MKGRIETFARPAGPGAVAPGACSRRDLCTGGCYDRP